MDPDLTALATAGATALVQQMTTDAWARLRDRFARVLSREGGGEADAVAGELDQARDEVIAARGDEDEMSLARGEWRQRMRRALVANPEVAGELQEILDDLARSEGRQSATYTINNTIESGEYHGVTIQAGIMGQMNHGQLPPPRN